MALPKGQTIDTATEITSPEFKYDEKLVIGSKRISPKTVNGRCVGRLVALEYLEPTNEVRQLRNGATYTDKQPQLAFTLEVATEESEMTMDLRFWTNTTVDGIKNNDGQFSRLTRLFIALNIVDEAVLTPTVKVPDYDLNNLAGEYFSFKVELKGRLWKPDITSFKHIENIEEYKPELEPKAVGFNTRETEKASA